MVMSQKAYILFYIRKQPENGHAGPAVPSRPSTAPPVSQRTASLAREDSLKATLSTSGETRGRSTDDLMLALKGLRVLQVHRPWEQVSRALLLPAKAGAPLAAAFCPAE